jgi:hypothetical protein
MSGPDLVVDVVPNILIVWAKIQCVNVYIQTKMCYLPMLVQQNHANTHGMALELD